MKIPIFPGFHTIKMVDFPASYVSLQEGKLADLISFFVGKPLRWQRLSLAQAQPLHTHTRWSKKREKFSKFVNALDISSLSLKNLKLENIQERS